MKLLIEDIDNFEIISEAKENGIREHFLRGPFMQMNVPNRNNRIYREHIVKPSIQKYIDESVTKNRAVGTLGHEDTPKISEDKISHLITKLEFNGNDIIGEAKILNTIPGQHIKAMIDGGVNFGMSSRALGSVKNIGGINEVQEDFMLSCIDCVLAPSGISCYVEGILESKDWIYIDGIGWTEQFFEESKKTLQKIKSKDIEPVALKIFENFISKL